MDKEKIIGWGKWIVAHGVAWAGASWLGMEAVKAEDAGAQAAQAIAALALVIWSLYDSYKGRKKVAE